MRENMPLPFEFSETMTNNSLAIASLLMDIEMELRKLNLWAAEMPSAEALASTQPFAVDVLTFPQWLQFIFLPRMQYLLEQQLPLPVNCGIAPMAEEYFAPLQLDSSHLVHHLRRVDMLLSTD